jgi:hypothetical protein
LPPPGFPAGRKSAGHTEYERADKLPRYAAPTLFQGLTKPIPPLFSCIVVVILWILLVHALLEMLLEVFNRVAGW